MAISEELQDKPLALILNQILKHGETSLQLGVAMVHILRRDNNTVFMRRGDLGWLYPPTFLNLWKREEIEVDSMDEEKVEEGQSRKSDQIWELFNL